MMKRLFGNKFYLVTFLLFLFLFVSTGISYAYVSKVGNKSDAKTTEYTTKYEDLLRKTNTKETYQYSVWEPAVYETSEMNQQSFTNETVKALIGSLNDKMVGCVTCPPEYKGLGAIQGIGNMMAALYTNPPASTKEYFADLGRNLGVKSAYAQSNGGIGFTTLTPLLPLWKNFRNLAYFFFVIVFVFMGFAMMFRMKINPQTVISIQNAIPRMVVALILVTFSYAIAGLLIDFIVYVVSAIGLSVIEPNMFIDKVVNLVNDAIRQVTPGSEIIPEENPNILVFFWMYVWRGLEYALAIAGVLNPLSLLTNIAGAPQIITSLTTITTTPLPTSFMADIIITVLAIVLLVSFFRIFLVLITSYVKILLAIILGPLQIMIGILPGQNGFSKWVKGLVVNLSVFPAVIIMVALSAKIYESFTTGVTGYNHMWVPPIIRPPLPSVATFRQTLAEFVGAMAAYGILILIPKVAEIIKANIEGKPFDYAGGFKGGFAPIIAPIAAPIGFVGGAGKDALFKSTSKSIGNYGKGLKERYLSIPRREQTTRGALTQGGNPPRTGGSSQERIRDLVDDNEEEQQ